MRIVPFIVCLLLTIGLVVLLDNKWGSIPPIAKFLSPQQGFWQNAEDVDHDFNADLHFSRLKGKTSVYLDERLVPHIFAENDEDAYFVQGYLHAKFRLWQMEFQTFAAAGRISEKMGNDPRFIRFDREQRRSGMVYGAEKALAAIEENPVTKSSCDAYTAGVNAYIHSLSKGNLPVEYKLLDYQPEEWSNLKCALFLKQMSKTLSGNDNDLENTSTKKILDFDQLMSLNPQVPDSLEPIIPKGTVFAPQGVTPVAPPDADSLYFGKKDSVHLDQVSKPDPNNGSNNWAVAGSKTKSGAPILCNDPHLELSFPSIWYEMQITTPHVNVYGVSFPGSPNIIIGFNDSIAWGVTNSQRDVRDYYEITFRDDSKKEYRFNDQWKPTELRVEAIKVRGGNTVYDTVAYTVFGPVMFDKSFSDELTQGKGIALRWTAHDKSNESLTFYQLNRARNYEDYATALQSFTCPGQNFLFASKAGNIAIWQQGNFPARWYGQGTYVMPGIDSSYMWQGFIPQQENPHIVNPERGFLVSANQRPADSTYPYFIPGNYITQRGAAITKILAGMEQVTPEMMMQLQNNYYSIQAANMLPLMLRNVNESALDNKGKKYLDIVRKWDYYTNPDAVGPTIYQQWLDSIETGIWSDEFAATPHLSYPGEQTLYEYLVKDSAFKYIDDIRTPQVETLPDVVTAAFNKVTQSLVQEDSAGSLGWATHKGSMIYHLLRTAVMPFAQPIHAGGWSNVINATTKSHGPSWRMVVQLTQTTEAYGVYPGGQSGNPGSCYYNSFVDNWEHGKYFRLFFMKPVDAGDQRIKWTMTFSS